MAFKFLCTIIDVLVKVSSQVFPILLSFCKLNCHTQQKYELQVSPKTVYVFTLLYVFVSELIELIN